MKVFDLTCRDGHRFEGWFSSAERYAEQIAASAVRCPLCDSSEIHREPSAPRLNFGGEAPAAEHTRREPSAAPPAAAIQALALEQMRRLLTTTENVGPRFAEEARRIHYEEATARPIRGTATEHERRALHDEGIETLNIALPAALTETMQ